MANKKVLLITYYWPPSGGAGVQRWLKFSKFLPSLGILPVVVTVDEKKASYPVLDHSLGKEVPDDVQVFRTNTFEPFELYKKFTGKKEIPFAGFANEGTPSFFQRLSRFIRGNLFIPDARKGWNKYALKVAEQLIRKHGITTVITTSPPHSTQLIGLALKQKLNVRWIADLRDPWTDIYYYKELSHTSWAKEIDKKLERKVLESTDEVIVSSNTTRTLFLGKSENINPEKVHAIPNGFDDNDFDIPSAPPANEFYITYSGTVTEVYGLQSFIAALRSVINRHTDIKFRLRFVGSVSSGLKDSLIKAFPAEIEIIPHVTHKEAIRFLMSSTALLMAIPFPEQNRHTIPGKLFEYLAARKPIVCIGSNDSDVAKIITECEAGRSFIPAEVDDIRSYLDLLISQWRVNPDLDVRSSAYKKYSRLNQTHELVKIINR